jgi:hypothetical protein
LVTAVSSQNRRLQLRDRRQRLALRRWPVSAAIPAAGSKIMRQSIHAYKRKIHRMSLKVA